MQPNPLLQGLQQMSGQPPAQSPLIQGENPFGVPQAGGVVPALPGIPQQQAPMATPAPNLTTNPAKQVTSMEELLFGLQETYRG